MSFFFFKLLLLFRFVCDALKRHTTSSYLPLSLPARSATHLRQQCYYQVQGDGYPKQDETDPDETKAKTAPGRPGDELDPPRSPSPLSPGALYRLYGHLLKQLCDQVEAFDNRVSLLLLRHCDDPRPTRKAFSSPAPRLSAWPRKWASRNRNRNRNRQDKTGTRGSRPARQAGQPTGSHCRQPPRQTVRCILVAWSNIHCHRYPQVVSVHYSTPSCIASQTTSFLQH